jgi:hypothetical protein
MPALDPAFLSLSAALLMGAALFAATLALSLCIAIGTTLQDVQAQRVRERRGERRRRRHLEKRLRWLTQNVAELWVRENHREDEHDEADWWKTPPADDTISE